MNNCSVSPHGLGGGRRLVWFLLYCICLVHVGLVCAVNSLCFAFLFVLLTLDWWQFEVW